MPKPYLVTVWKYMYISMHPYSVHKADHCGRFTVGGKDLMYP